VEFDGGLVILLTDDEAVRDLNRQFRDQDKPTNVLSFPSRLNPEAHLGDVAEHCGLGDWCGRPAVVVTGVCGKIEAELAGLAPEEAREFMAELGIAEPGTARLLRENYRLLGLISFFTVGKDEVRAWTIPQGLNAQRAAGVIHTDLEKGFIRAEVCRQDDLVALGSMPAVREKGLLRLEGKEYIVADGDVFHVRFNI